MSVSSIVDKILEDAKNQEAVIIEKAAQDSSKIADKATEKANLILENSIKKAEIEGSAKKERAIQSAILTVRNNKLSAKQDVIATVLESAMNELVNMDNDSFVEFFETTIKSSGFKGEGVVVCNPKRLDSVDKKVIKKINKELNIDLSIGECDESVKDGFIIKQGNVYCNFTFESIIESMIGDLVSGISKELF